MKLILLSRLIMHKDLNFSVFLKHFYKKHDLKHFNSPIQSSENFGYGKVNSHASKPSYLAKKLKSKS